MEVWIDQDLCTGDGLCEEIAPDLFEVYKSDGLAYVKELGKTMLGEDGKPIHQGSSGRVAVPENLLGVTIEAADECPGECIFIEVE